MRVVVCSASSSTSYIITQGHPPDCEEMAISPAAILPFLKGTRPYALYVLCVLMVVFMLNQKDRFLLGVTGRVVAKDLGFGDRSCVPHVPAMNNKSNISSSTLCDGECLEIRHEEE